MIHIDRVVVVEGKYDKIKLESLIDSPIVTTNGFSIFRDEELQAMLRALAKARGLIVLTDSDAAGFKIRGFLWNICGKENIVDAYIPDLYGKEKRKAFPSKEGKLGVEGVDAATLRRVLEQAGAVCKAPPENCRPITKADLYQMGLSGGADSREKRRSLQKRLGLPAQLSANGLLTVLNALMTYEEFAGLLKEES